MEEPAATIKAWHHSEAGHFVPSSRPLRPVRIWLNEALAIWMPSDLNQLHLQRLDPLLGRERRGSLVDRHGCQ